MARRNVVLGLAAVGVLVMWVWLLVIEILDTLGSEITDPVTRTDLRIGVMTLLTGLLGAALAILVSAGGDQLRDVPRALGFTGNRLPQLFTFVYAVVYVVGVLVGLGVALTNEGVASPLLIAVTTGGIGTLTSGVAAWLGLNFTPPSGARSTLQAEAEEQAGAVAEDIDLRSGADSDVDSDGEAAELIEELAGPEPDAPGSEERATEDDSTSSWSVAN